MIIGLLSALALTLKDSLLFVCMIQSNAFPKPLNKDDEARYLKLWAKGDANARNVLIEHNLRLVAHVAKKYDSKGEVQEDLVSVGTIGLIKGIESYSSEKGTKLATYVARCIDNEILMYFRNNRKTQKDVSLHDPIGTDKEGNEVTLIDILSTEQTEVSDRVENKLERGRIREYIQSLDERERAVVRWRFGIQNGNEKTQRQIAKELGISRSYVSRIEKRALVKLFHRLYNCDVPKSYGVSGSETN